MKHEISSRRKMWVNAATAAAIVAAFPLMLVLTNYAAWFPALAFFILILRNVVIAIWARQTRKSE
jgi:hypothetical protein